MSKIVFMNLCQKNGVPIENAKRAWNKIQQLSEHIKKNWDSIELLEYMSPDKRLKLRQFAAEKGTEYTPKELDELVDFILLVKHSIGKP